MFRPTKIPQDDVMHAGRTSEAMQAAGKSPAAKTPQGYARFCGAFSF